MLMIRCTFGGSPTALTSCLDKDFGPLPPIVYMCLFLPSDFLLLDVATFLVVYGMTNLHTLPPLLTFKLQLKMHLFRHYYPDLTL